MGLLQIVHLETNEADADLVGAELKNSALVRVRTLAELSTELVRPVDIVLADSGAPSSRGLAALALARDKAPDAAFIFISGTSDPGVVTESLRAGATDFVPKTHPAKLIVAIRRVIREARTQRDLENARRELLRHVELLDLANDAIVISDAQGKISYWNRGAERLYGWSREDATGREVHGLLLTGPPETLAAVLETLQAAHHWEGQIEQVRRDGSVTTVSTGWTLQGSDAAAFLPQLSVDVTNRIAAEEALRRSEERYRRFVDEDLTGNLIVQPDDTIVTCKPRLRSHLRFRVETCGRDRSRRLRPRPAAPRRARCFSAHERNQPSVRAIVASGYLEPSMRTEILRAGVVDTVQKPYDFRELIERIRSIIGEPEPEEDRQPSLF
ncbi:MAG: PAS domain S-box protein [Chthoniobacterales bacterium]|nr:PAS domain S-box protein [Chthoniobacterales bacterium]